MNYSVNIGCKEIGTKEAGLRRRTSSLTRIENRDSDLATMCQLGRTVRHIQHSYGIWEVVMSCILR